MRRVLYVACLAALAGCAGLPSNEPPAPLKAASSYSTQRSFDAPAAAWPDEAWWAGYKDSQLDTIMAEALAGSPSVAIARARLQHAEAVAQVSGAALMPQGAVNGSVTKQKQSYNYLSPPAFTPRNWNDYGRATFDLSWELDLWGKNRAALASATSEAQAAAADEAQARITLSTSIASAYAELARLHAARDTAQAALDVRTKTADLFRTRRANGLETTGSVRQVEARVASSEADVLTLDEQIGLQRNRIAALMGAGPDRGLSISRPAVDISRSFGLPAQLPAHLLSRRPDVVAARLRAEAAAKRIDQARAAFYPDVNLIAFLGHQSLSLGAFGSSGSSIGSVGPAISLPIFDGGRLQGQLGGARADYAEAAATYERTLVQALQDVAGAATSRKSLDGELDRTLAAVDAARDAWRIQKNRYEGGLASYLDVLSAEDALLASLRTLTDLQSRSFSLDVALVRALGGGYSTHS
jgi:NodT family efflux transporter outer membrane factor (OMF) lipoprotein